MRGVVFVPDAEGYLFPRAEHGALAFATLLEVIEAVGMTLLTYVGTLAKERQEFLRRLPGVGSLQEVAHG